MSGRLRLETFEWEEAGSVAAPLSFSDAEEAKLASFEKGYAAGWEDAVAAQDAETERLRAELARSLEDLSFTYAEAHRNVLRALEPLLSDMVTKIMPQIARSTLGPMVVEQLMPVATGLADVPVELAMAAETRPLVEPLLATAGARIPVRIAEDPTLAPGQVFLRFGERETRIDLAAVTAAIGAVLSDFFHEAEPEERRYA